MRPFARSLTWSALLAGAQAGDVATTWLGLRLGIPEGNPAVRVALAHGSFLAFGAIKLALVTGIVFLLWVTGRHLRGIVHRATWRSVQVLTVVFTAVAAANAGRDPGPRRLARSGPGYDSETWN